MLGLLGKDIRLAIDLDSRELAPGAEVRGIVTAECAQQKEVERGVVSLRCVEEYEQRVRRYRRNRGYDTVTDRESQELYDLETDLTDRTVIFADQPSQYPFSFQLPDDLPSTYQGNILKVTWELRARLDVRRAVDTRASVDLMVYQLAQGPFPAHLSPGDAQSYDQCSLRMELEKEVWAAGEPVRGTLYVEPRESFGVQEVRIELKVREDVPVHEGHTHADTLASVQLQPAGDLVGGVPLELPFEVAAPSTLRPSIATPHGAAHWEVDAVLARSLRTDLRLTRGIHVYTAPDQGANV